LYNLKSDIDKKQNLVSEYPEKADELKSMLVEWHKEVKTEIPGSQSRKQSR